MKTCQYNVKNNNETFLSTYLNQSLTVPVRPLSPEKQEEKSCFRALDYLRFDDFEN